MLHGFDMARSCTRTATRLVGLMKDQIKGIRGLRKKMACQVKRQGFHSDND